MTNNQVITRRDDVLKLRSRTIKKRESPNIKPKIRKRKKLNRKAKRYSLRLLPEELLSTFKEFLRTRDENLLMVENCEASQHMPTEEEVAQRTVNQKFEKNKIGSSPSVDDLRKEEEMNVFCEGYVLRKDMSQPDREKCKIYESTIHECINTSLASNGNTNIPRCVFKDSIARSISQYHCANCVRSHREGSPFKSHSISVSKEEDFQEKYCILAFLRYMFCQWGTQNNNIGNEAMVEPIGIGFWESRQSYLLTFVY